MKRVISLLLLFAIMISVASAETATSSLQNIYAEAELLMVQGDYAGAASKFESMGTYSDASQMAMYCKAIYAAESLKMYSVAVDAFVQLGSFKDSIQMNKYYTARYYESISDSVILETATDDELNDAIDIYNESIVIYNEIILFKDCLQRISDCEAKISSIKNELSKRINTEKEAIYQQAVMLENEGKYEEAISIYESLNIYKDSLERSIACRNAINENRYQQAWVLADEAKYTEAIAIYKDIGDYKDSKERMAVCVEMQNNNCYQQAVQFVNEGKYEEAIALFSSISYYKDSLEQISKTYIFLGDDYLNNGLYSQAMEAYTKGNADTAVLDKARKQYLDKIVSTVRISENIQFGFDHVVALRADGTILATGSNEYGQCNVEKWTEIVAISASGYLTVGLRADGTVVATGDNEYGQCNVRKWKDIKKIYTCYDRTIGICIDGTVVAVGNNDRGQCEVEDWNDIIDINLSGGCTVALDKKGNIFVAGSQSHIYDFESRANNWNEIVEIEQGIGVFGLTQSGSVVSTEASIQKSDIKTSDMKDVIKIFVSGDDVFGITQDGRLIVGGNKENKQKYNTNIPEWNNLVSMCVVDGHYMMGLKADGSIAYGKYGAPFDYEEAEQWTDIVALTSYAGCLIGMKSDGTLVITGKNTNQYDISGWDNIRITEYLPEVEFAARAEQMKLLKEYTDKEIIKQAQTILNAAGYDCGTPDGIAGKGTSRAVTNYQTDKNLNITGTITYELLISLGIITK